MRYTIAFTVLATLSVMVACSPAKGDRRGHEFMPDMVHTTGYEANLYNYYSYNRWGTEEDYKKYASPRTSVSGTVARGQISVANATDGVGRQMAMSAFTGEGDGTFALTPNGSVPYYYTDTEEERLRATREISRNPFPITDAGLARGKDLYIIYCGICHGAKGDGQGYLVREEDPTKGIVAGIYPAAPANFLLDTFILTSVGRLYHSIMFGKNVMGPYADKLTYQERWEVIHYIRSLQAQDRKAEYSASVNTFNKEATPWVLVDAELKKAAPLAAPAIQQQGSDTLGHMNQH